MENNQSHLDSEYETNMNLFIRFFCFCIGWFYTCMNRFRFRRVGKGFRAPYPISVINGRNITIGDDVHIGRRCQIYAYTSGAISIGSGVFIDDDVTLYGGRHIIVGRDVQLIKGTIIKCNEIGSVVIGDRTIISEGCLINGDIRIGENVLFEPRVMVNEEISNDKNKHRKRGTIIIQRNVRIRYNANVSENVSIGEGAVIETNEIVKKDVPPFSNLSTMSTTS